jgi:adenine-specific DNA-methyltransferase
VGLATVAQHSGLRHYAHVLRQGTNVSSMCAATPPGKAPHDSDDWPRAPSKHGIRKHLRKPSQPPLEIFTTTLWDYPSQHYISSSGNPEQGDRDYTGATPSWVIWQCLQRYTREGDLVVDPMCGGGTTIDVANDLNRRVKGFDLSPPRDDDRSDVVKADARKLPLKDSIADFVFIDPPYSTHVDYSDDPRDIGKLYAGGPDGGRAYFDAMENVIAEIERILKPGKFMALYVSDSWRKGREGSRHQGIEGSRDEGMKGSRGPRGSKESIRDNASIPRSLDASMPHSLFMPIGFELFSILRKHFTPVDIIAVVRHNAKLQKGNWHTAAREGNYFLRGFNYLFIMRKPDRH